MSHNVPLLSLADYTYDLPDDRIAQHPLAERDASKLLVADVSTGIIQHEVFRDVAAMLPPKSLIIANRSRVIAARLPMQKPTGGNVEVLLSKPVAPSADPAIALAATSPTRWEALASGRNVVPGTVLRHVSMPLTATIVERNGADAVVEVAWEGNTTMAEMLDAAGVLPLPPYMRREATKEDCERYQTVYATEQGSVAAPTAGLHFTEAVRTSLKARGVAWSEVTLHVGLGTFKPVDVEDARNHVMHAERIAVTRQTVDAILQQHASPRPWITVVGTTSMRTLESWYAVGCALALGRDVGDSIVIDQWAAYDPEARSVSCLDAFSAIADTMDTRQLDTIWAETHLMLAPGAHIGVCDALITNFHQPNSTLLLLVAAFCNGALWKDAYRQALDHGYRFLSYGDATIFFRRPM
jgi:S-adenosylmethionine:tRNA ribosyltransferase-isomerase